MTEPSSSNLAQPPAAAAKALPKPKVLVIDDSRIVHAAIKKAIKEEFEVLDAYDGEEGWIKLREENEIQLVITDQGMPKLDGFFTHQTDTGKRHHPHCRSTRNYGDWCGARTG